MSDSLYLLEHVSLIGQIVGTVIAEGDLVIAVDVLGETLGLTEGSTIQRNKCNDAYDEASQTMPIYGVVYAVFTGSPFPYHVLHTLHSWVP